jgi:predicted PhzF superfamily epimerase YddE/YHI9
VTVDLLVVDAFRTGPFSGNPAAVVPLNAPAPEAWMQAVAAQMNLSETAFLHPTGGDAEWALRWFTPTTEVDLCGHATLAAAHALYETGRADASAPVAFETRSGRLTVAPSADGYAMDFPATPPAETPAPDGLDALLGSALAWYGRSRFDGFAVVGSERAVRDLAPDPAAVAALGTRGLVVTARADDGAPYDVVSRFFAPGVGVVEDPVTGSAHCAIGPYWAARLGARTLVCHQASARGGRLVVTVAGDRVTLAGAAATVLRGTLLATPDAGDAP